MKALIPASLVAASLVAAVAAVAAVALFAVAYNPADEKTPGGAVEKIAAALPSEAYAKPEKPRKLLVFSRTNGFRDASIATGKVALSEMGKRPEPTRP